MMIKIENGVVRIGERFSISVQRTLRIPDDGKIYPLPPGLSALPLFAVDDYVHSVPVSWREQGGVFAPMYQREAMWLGFDAADWKPNAVKIGVGGINAVSGEPWDEVLGQNPQNYIVCPNQPWLDGINVGDGHIRQFVAMPCGEGYTIEAQLTGAERVGGIQVLVFDPMPGKFPDQPPPRSPSPRGLPMRQARRKTTEGELGVAAGGRIKQRIYPDPYGLETWDQTEHAGLFIHLVNSDQFKQLTGEEPPPTPINAKTYTDYGLPWFDLYDENAGDLPASKRLGQVESVQEIDTHKGSIEQDDSIEVQESQIRKLRHSRFGESE